MRSYEIQVFKAGKWEFDSYFEDRESAMFDADQLVADVRIQGVRVLKENYNQESNIAKCDVIFTRMRNKNGPGDWRNKARKKSENTTAPSVRHERARQPVRRKKPVKKRNSPVLALVTFALILLVGGMATLYGLGGFPEFAVPWL
ncbi:MAG: hypothetical protein GKS01_17635 [Alphaproteobacteria bacterium]|nr:hypothetical protein [Alphaproteobacteria bacterium]